MKYFLSCFMMLFFCYQIGLSQLNFEPKYPVPGETITMTYDLINSPLYGVEDIDFLLYSFDEGYPAVHEIAYQQSDNQLMATFTTDKTTKLVSVILRDARDEKVLDNREGRGYQKLMCDGQEPLAGAYYQKAMLKNNYSRIVGIDRDQEKSIVLIEREIDKFGPLDRKQQETYLSLLSRVDKERAKTLAEAFIPTLKKKSRGSAEYMASLKQCYDLLDDKEMAEKIANKIRKKYPNGEFVQAELINQFFDSKDINEKVNLYGNINSESLPENYKSSLNYMASNLATHFATEGDWEKFEHYMAKIEDNLSLASAFNSVAWKLSGEGLEEEAIDVEKGLKYSKKSLKNLDIHRSNLENKPKYFTVKQWERNLGYSHSSFADTYALLSYKAGNHEDALTHQQKACELRKFEDASLNEVYSIYYEEVKGPKATGQLLEGFIEEGHASAKMKEQFQRIFMDHYTKADLYARFMADLESKGKEKLEEEIIKDILDMESPNFTLVNLDGQTVSSESLKGKVVVLDFWATWCGPCIKSFPGMQKAVNKYQDDPEVEFLFVDTWQSEEDKEKIVKDFIAEHEYTFNVLMDNENKVVADYKVEGIPTKFIIGKDQKIRFKSVGFGGNDDKLLDELSIMIEYLKKGDQKKVKVSMK